MEKLCRIIGAENYDPDKTYELTADNVKKMLAIYMRFRYRKVKKNILFKTICCCCGWV